ncbi:hypothetical protein NEMBOFW57_003564 [Staphylotrichum longicolle]|uniref:Uncharacterized protein n=1 Tax=Staphylotrichum longicolle TaxID=669026 RepID=A0AAD4F837_9PEZI|nr:hypothetical protein NEMBOFW57_003564 [Staphylotrichum longicolle]
MVTDQHGCYRFGKAFMQAKKLGTNLQNSLHTSQLIIGREQYVNPGTTRPSHPTASGPSGGFAIINSRLVVLPRTAMVAHKSSSPAVYQVSHDAVVPGASVEPAGGGLEFTPRPVLIVGASDQPSSSSSTDLPFCGERHSTRPYQRLPAWRL